MERVRPRSFWLRCLALCYVLLMFELSTFGCMLMHAHKMSVPQHWPVPVHVQDVPLLDHRQYLDLIKEGSARFWFDGELYEVDMSYFDGPSFRALSHLVRAM